MVSRGHACAPALVAVGIDRRRADDHMAGVTDLSNRFVGLTLDAQVEVPRPRIGTERPTSPAPPTSRRRKVFADSAMPTPDQCVSQSRPGREQAQGRCSLRQTLASQGCCSRGKPAGR